ncbi:MRC1-like domain-containing protein [Lasiosphaeria hispida]|uniref:MRC1-like domain-containing protein n=1 Tax=Lasiosphaeria hispida TaxID=260671 RepID=A0AAJ0HPG2_9PEZI|nr:MRC1-like domain-containing protein [Lasiosphaeria hispida]
MPSPRSSPAPAPGRVSRSASPTSTQPSATQQSDATTESSSEDDAILRPRGGLASRMQPATTERTQSGSETERGSPDEDDEDVVVTARPRKLKQRQRSCTPEINTRQSSASPRPNSVEQPVPDSPGLFVSPAKPRSPSARSTIAESDDDDDEIPSLTSLVKNPRYLALLERKRQERKAREAEEARKKAEHLAAQKQSALEDMMDEDEDDNITDDEGGRKLTQGAVRPTRKASKKAMEEMSRETQRLTRSLQLAHEAKVRKKISKSALFERFNFKPEGVVEASKLPPSSLPTTPGSAAQQTDAEMKDGETPPSSPPPAAEKNAQEPSATTVPLRSVVEEDSDGELPTLEAALEASAAQKKLDKGKGKATVADGEADERSQDNTQRAKRNVRVKLLPPQANHASVNLDDDDDDLQIQPTRKSKLDAIFDRIPVNQAQESRSMHILRRLAHIDDPEKMSTAPPGGHKNPKQKQAQSVMSVGELQVNLMQRARMQAKVDRDRHLEMLRSKGIHVQTAEEREQELAEVEDMVARARREAEEIMDREREAAKEDRKARKAAGEQDPLGWDDSDEGTEDEYEDDAEDEEIVEVELSGSEDGDVAGGDDEDMDSGAEEEAEPAAILFDELAESADESEGGDGEKQTVEQDSDEEVVTSTSQARRRPRKHVTILSDDEDDAPHVVEATPRPKSNFPKSPIAPNTGSPHVPTSVLRSATKTFIPGLAVVGAAGLSLTQIFAGTMDDSQTGSAPLVGTPSQPMPTFDIDAFPDSNFSQTCGEANDDMIMDSQPTGKTQDPESQRIHLRFSQSQTQGFDLLPDTQASELEPTQDGGFQNFSPLLQRFVELPASTVETVKLHGSQENDDHAQSPLVRRTGKLRRRTDLATAPSPAALSEHEEDGDPMEGLETDEFGFGITTSTASAFNVMKEAAVKEKKKKTTEAFDKKKSKAREMVEDQAAESEDEYAGIGGVDGEDDSDEDDQSVKEMIDDETKNNEGDERKLAAFYADRERASDEKQVEKLFHDITTGMLRRKRNGDWDELDEDDDGGEARRRLKRRQFAKMQRALFADERISKVAENPRNQAFLKTIEDVGSDDDMDFIFAPPPTVPGLESQSSVASDKSETLPTIPDSQPQANPRRTKDGKRPSNIGDIRESLSNLLDEPQNSSSVIPATELGSDSDGSDEDDQDTRPQTSHSLSRSSSAASSNKENRNPRRDRVAVVDRISLKRNSSSALSAASRLAFAAPTTSTNTLAANREGSFKVPALLRRATTNSLISTSSTTSGMSSTGVTTSTSRGASTANDTAAVKIKKPAGKQSGINYFARENERRAAVAESDRRREARKWKGAEGRSKVVGGLFGGGKFE